MKFVTIAITIVTNLAISLTDKKFGPCIQAVRKDSATKKLNQHIKLNKNLTRISNIGLFWSLKLILTQFWTLTKRKLGPSASCKKKSRR